MEFQYFLQLLVCWKLMMSIILNGFEMTNITEFDVTNETYATNLLPNITEVIASEISMFGNDSLDNTTIFSNVTDSENFTLADYNFTINESVTYIPYGEETKVSSTEASIVSVSAACNCDLTAKSCNINCCCDQECTEADRNAFSECVPPPKTVDENYCISKHVVYIDNVKSEELVERNDLLCIVRDSFKERYMYLDHSIIETKDDYKKFVPHPTYSWASSKNNIREDGEVKLKAGEPVYIKIKGSGKISKWWLPTSLFSKKCEGVKLARYIMDEETMCHQIIGNLTCLNNKWLNAQTYYKGFYLWNPHIRPFNASDMNNTLLQESVTDMCIFSNSCIPIIPRDNYICRDVNGIPQNCTLINGEMPTPKIGPDRNVCNNVITMVEFSVIHDGINGIIEGNVKFETDTIKFSQDSFQQKFIVNYYWKDSDGDIFRKSGNPGYLIGQPILAGNLFKTRTLKSTILLDSNRNNWFTIMGKDSNGYCSHQKSNRVSVKFGENIQTGCLYKVVYNVKGVMSCNYMQTQIMNILNGTSFPQYVGIFGNSDIHNIGDWVKVYKEGEPAKPYPDATSEGWCSSVVLGVDIKIAYANIGSLANPQPKIIGVLYQYLTPQYIRFLCFGPSCAIETTHVIELKTSVSFTDVSKPAHPMYAEIPIMKISFPHDFFYPFLSGYSKSTRNTTSVLYLLSLILIVSVLNFKGLYIAL